MSKKHMLAIPWRAQIPIHDLDYLFSHLSERMMLAQFRSYAIFAASIKAGDSADAEDWEE